MTQPRLSWAKMMAHPEVKALQTELEFAIFHYLAYPTAESIHRMEALREKLAELKTKLTGTEQFA